MFCSARLLYPIPHTVHSRLTFFFPTRSEHTAFALRCKHRGAQFAWLDAGVHVPVTKGFWSLFKQRARENAALAQLLMEDSSDLTKRLDPTTQTMLATTCVSSVFAKLASVWYGLGRFPNPGTVSAAPL